MSEESTRDPELDSERGGQGLRSSDLGQLIEGLSIDPIARVLSVAPGLGLAESASRAAVGSSPFAELWGRLVRRVAWGGDGRRGTARIEIGQGEWAGAQIVVHAVERQVAVEIELPAGAPLESWRERIAGRLRERGLTLSELTIR